MHWRVASVFLLVSGCVSGPRALTSGQLESFATRRYAGAFDEVFDATALSLEQLGFALDQLDASQGTFVAKRRDGRGYRVSIRSLEDGQSVTALPFPEQNLWVLDGTDGETSRWNALESRTRELLASWREHPEWVYAATREVLGVLTFRARLPKQWEQVEPSVSRRVVVVQRSRARRAINPALLFEVSRRRPVNDARALLVGAAEITLSARGRLTWPEEIDLWATGSGVSGRATVLDGSVARPITYHLWQGATAAWMVRIAAVCGPLESDATCEDEWRALTASVVSQGFEAKVR
jgi:hypothetical protein